MAKVAKRILLFSTGALIIISNFKLFLGKPDLFDRLLALFTVILFFMDQIAD